MTNFEIISYMQPVEYEDGHGFKTIVSPRPGYHILISEIHRRGPIRPVDETICFPCDANGKVTSWTEITSGESTSDALVDLRERWTPDLHRGVW